MTKREVLAVLMMGRKGNGNEDREREGKEYGDRIGRKGKGKEGK